MASSKNIRNPPLLEASPSFEQWEKSLQYWQAITDLAKSKQGPAVTLSLTGKALEAAMELDFAEVSADDGVKKVVERLRKIYAKDTVEAAYVAFENFIHFKRENSISILDYITEFESKYSKAKKHGFDLSDTTQGFFLLNQAGLSEDHKKLVRATISDLGIEEVKSKLTRVFGNGKSVSIKESDEMLVKVENINLTEEESEEAFYGYGQSRYSNYGNQYNRPYQNRGNSYSRGNVRGGFRPYAGGRGFRKDNQPNEFRNR